ncbi:hypothetical protein HY570_04250 [Candidatus Micrarchaeota archaeon]|nr:hypothetical protein [Candidatus Micrarchaeota archaeon]
MGQTYWINPEPLIELYLKLGIKYAVPMPLLREMETAAYSLIDESLTSENIIIERNGSMFGIVLKGGYGDPRHYLDSLANRTAKRLETMLTREISNLAGVSKHRISSKFIPELIFCRRDFALGRVEDYSEIKRNGDSRVVDFCKKIYMQHRWVRKYPIEEFEQLNIRTGAQFNLFQVLACIEERVNRGLSCKGTYGLAKAQELFELIASRAVTISFVNKCASRDIFLSPQEYVSLYTQIDKGFFTLLVKRILGQDAFTFEKAVEMIKGGVAVDILKAVYEQPRDLGLGQRIRLVREEVFPDFTNLFLTLGLGVGEIIRLNEVYKKGIELSFLEELVLKIEPKDPRFAKCVEVHIKNPIITVDEVLVQLESGIGEERECRRAGAQPIVETVTRVSRKTRKTRQSEKPGGEELKGKEAQRQYELDYSGRVSASSLPRLSFGEWRAIMERMGGEEVSKHPGSHAIFKFGRRRVPLPRHGEVSRFTVASALNRAGVRRDQLMRVL